MGVGRGELQHLLVYGGARRTPFLIREGARRDAKYFNTFCPRRTRRGTEDGNTFLSAEDAEGAENGFLIHGGPLRAAKNIFVRGEYLFDPRRATKGREEHLCPRRTRRGAENGNTFLSAEDAENTL